MKTRIVVAEGKTKVVYKMCDMFKGCVIVKSKDDITKNDNPSQTEVMNKKAEYSTATACAVFSLLKKAGIPVAFERRFSETEFLAPECKMIPLEVVVRRYAVGSYLKRLPGYEKKKNEAPHRFNRLVFELFLKTTGGVIKNKDGVIIKVLPSDCLEIDKKKPIDDPLILNPYKKVWELKHPKIPYRDEGSDLGCCINSEDILPLDVTVEIIEAIARKTFLVLEGAWAKLSCYLINFKIEFGIGPDGELLVADVIDNDSWRLRTREWEELSKQLFRDNAKMGNIADKYALVANLVDVFAAQSEHSYPIAYMHRQYAIEALDK